MTALTDDEVVQIAREAVAADRGLCSPYKPEFIRDGSLDRYTAVQIAILGARAVAAKLSGGAGEPYDVGDFSDDCERIVSHMGKVGIKDLKVNTGSGWSIRVERYATPPAEPAVVPPRPCTCHPDDNPPVPCAEKYALSECKPAPVADDLVERLHEREVKRLTAVLNQIKRFGAIERGWDVPHWENCCSKLLERITADAAVIAGLQTSRDLWRSRCKSMRRKKDAVIAGKDAEIERLQNYCGAAARDYAQMLDVLQNSTGHEWAEVFVRSAKELRETSEYMALAAVGKEDRTQWGVELNKLSAARDAAEDRITDLQAAIFFVLDGFGLNGPSYEVDEDDSELVALVWMFDALRAALNAGEASEGWCFDMSKAPEKTDLIVFIPESHRKTVWAARYGINMQGRRLWTIEAQMGFDIGKPVAWMLMPSAPAALDAGERDAQG